MVNNNNYNNNRNKLRTDEMRHEIIERSYYLCVSCHIITIIILIVLFFLYTNQLNLLTVIYTSIACLD